MKGERVGVGRWLALLATAAGCGGSSGTIADGGATDAGAQEAASDANLTPDAGTGSDVATDGGDAGGSLPGPGSWREEPSLGGARQETGVAALSGAIYVIGGFDGSSTIVATVESFDPATGMWSKRKSLPKPVHHAHVVALGGHIYVAGALQTNKFFALGDTFVYDPGADSWTAKTPMPAGTQRGGGAAIVLGGKVYVAGGLRAAVSVADFSAYDPVADSWETLPALPAPRDHLVAGSDGKFVFAIGGRAGGITSHTGRVDAYDPATGVWTSRAAMPTPRGGAAAATLGGRIVVAGGEGNVAVMSGVFPQVEAYDPLADTWSVLTAMKTPRHGTGAATVGDRLYVPGGATEQGFGAVAVVESFAF